MKPSLLSREPALVTSLIIGLLVAALHGVDVWLLGESWRVATSTGIQQVIALLVSGFAIRGLVVSPATIERTQQWLAAEQQERLKIIRGEG